MNKKQIISAAADLLRENDVRKSVQTKSERFHIRREGGDEEAVFQIDRKDRRVQYNVTDVQNILDALIHVAIDCMRRGEPFMLKGFGTLKVRLAKEHMVREPLEEIWHTIPACYRPKFEAGTKLTAAARAYGFQQDDNPDKYLPPPIYDEDEEEDDD